MQEENVKEKESDTLSENQETKDKGENSRVRYCMKCGYLVPLEEEICPKCKTPIYKKRNKKLKKIIVVCIFIFILGIIVSIPISKYIKNKNTYQKAEELMYSKKFEDAYTLYESISSFRDSKDKMKEAKYQQAEQLYGSSEFDEAIEIYKGLTEYKDSEEKILKVEQEKELYEAKELLKKAYRFCIGDGATLSADGLSLTIDGADQYDVLSRFDVESVIKTLKLPDSLKTKMEITNSLMGRQTEKYDNIKVSWTYHPDNGLDAVFEIVINN